MNNKNKMAFPFALPDPRILQKQVNQMNNHFIKLIDETVRMSFKNIINPSFLIKMKYKIMNSEEFISMSKKYDPIGIYQNLSLDLVTVEDVCKNIAFIHQYNMSIQKNPNDFEDETRYGKTYFEKIKYQVLDNIRFREYGSASYSNHYSVGYYPYLYALRVVVNFFSVELAKVIDHNFDKADGFERFRLRTISDIFRRASGILGLMEDNCTDACYGICRQIIEFNTHYKILVRFPEAVEEYGKFLNYQLEHNNTHEFPMELKEKCSKAFNEKVSNKKMIDYMNYGWMDAIEEFKKLDKKKYNIKGLFEFIDFQNKRRDRKILDGEIMKGYYEKCSLLSHGNQFLFNYFLGNIEISLYIFPIIEALAKDLKDIYGIATEINGIDILVYTRDRIGEAESMYITISKDSELGERNQKMFMR